MISMGAAGALNDASEPPFEQAHDDSASRNQPGILSPQMDAEWYPRSPTLATDETTDCAPELARQQENAHTLRKARKPSLIPEP